jgi:hypothetical protein
MVSLMVGTILERGVKSSVADARSFRAESGCGRPLVRGDGMAAMSSVLRQSLTVAGASMEAALAGTDPEDMEREPGPEWRSIDFILGEATMVLREALLAIGDAGVPDVPENFEARFGRWGTGAELGNEDRDLRVIFSEHLKALDEVVQSLEDHRLDEPYDFQIEFDEDGVFAATTIGEMIFSTSLYVQFLAGEASMMALALGKPGGDPFDKLLNGAC